MAVRKPYNRKYTNEDKARVVVALSANDDNVYRTAKDLGIPRETVKHWKKLWDETGVPNEIGILTETITIDYISDMERIRDMTLREIEDRIRIGGENVKTKDLIVMFGILEDKITRARGLATKRVETVVEMPDVRELGSQLGTFIRASLETAYERRREIVELDSQQAIKLALTKGD